MKITLTILLTFWLICGCAVGPGLPAARVPDVLPPSVAKGRVSRPNRSKLLSEILKWFEVFKDPQLQELIQESL